jgi:hypothetical protein
MRDRKVHRCWPRVRAGVLVSVVIGTCVAAAAPAAAVIAGGGPPVGSKAAALRYGGRLVALVKLPKGSRAAPAPAALREPGVTWQPGPELVDVGRVWRVPLSVGRAVTFFVRHPPDGMTLEFTGTTWSRNTRVSLLGYSPRSVPAWVAYVQVVLSLDAAGKHASYARADGEVIWYPPRSKAEQISGMRSLTITEAPAGSPEVTRTFTSPTAIRKLEAVLNSLPAEPISPIPCGGITVEYTASFAAKPGGAASVVVGLANACEGEIISVNGIAQPALADPKFRAVGYVAGLMR